MSLQICQGTTGFPIKLSQNLFSPWPGGINPSDPVNVRKLLVETDFEVNWSPESRVNIKVDNSLSQFLINGLDTSTSNTTITYGKGSDVTTYNCQPSLSLVNIQHLTLSQDKLATQELIMSFRIASSTVKQQNPSAPDVILLCRPVILVGETDNGSAFWQAVNRSAKTKSAVTVDKFKLSEPFTFDGIHLLPMMTYETCIPTQLIGGPNPALEGAIRIRVHVIPQPLYIPSNEDGSGKCSAVKSFILPVTGLVNIFGQSGYTNVQFTNGRSVDGKSNNYPQPTTPKSDALSLSIPAQQIDSWESVLQKFELLVPKMFLGKSLSEIAAANSIPKPANTNKGYKCYTIDPLKDIMGDQILIDPTTGETVEEAKKKYLGESTGGDSELTARLSGVPTQDTGILPGDVEEIILIVISTLGGLTLLAYLFYVIRLYMIHDYHNAQIHSVYFTIGFLVLFLISILISSDIQKKKEVPAHSSVTIK